MIVRAWEHIIKPHKAGADGIGFSEGETFWVHDCIIDLQSNPISELDEALGLTNGSCGTVERCVIRGAAKLVLIGSGDEEYIHKERGQKIYFRDCIIEQFGRRGPEVQDGYRVYMERCLVQDWGMKSRFKDRSFGAWAHHEGAIFATDCVFRQQSLKRGLWYWLADMIGHIGQAVNDEGLRGLFRRKTYLPGVLRALTADSTGYVEATNCWKSHREMLIENSVCDMPDKEADALIERLEQMRAELKKKLGID